MPFHGLFPMVVSPWLGLAMWGGWDSALPVADCSCITPRGQGLAETKLLGQQPGDRLDDLFRLELLRRLVRRRFSGGGGSFGGGAPRRAGER